MGTEVPLSPAPSSSHRFHPASSRIIVAVLAMFTLVALLAGCDDGNGDASVSASTRATTTSVPSTTTSAVPGATQVDPAMPTNATSTTKATVDTGQSATSLTDDEAEEGGHTASSASTVPAGPGSSTPRSTSKSTTPATTKTSTPACDAAGFATTNIDVRHDPEPGTTEGLLLQSVRTGSTDCYERVVWDFGDGAPAWFYLTRYVDSDGEFVMGQADPPEAPMAHVDGEAFLEVIMQASSVDFDLPGGPDFIVDGEPAVTGVSSIIDLVRIDDFEGQMTWIVGLDDEHPYRIFTLKNPSRLVIDFYTGG